MIMSAKVYDGKGRWRSLAVAFRMSPEENAELDRRVALSGLTKQDYFLRRIQERDVVVNGNPRVFKALRNQLASVLDELQRLEAVSGENDELLDLIQYIAQILDGMKTPPSEMPLL